MHLDDNSSRNGVNSHERYREGEQSWERCNNECGAGSGRVTGCSEVMFE